MVVGGPWITSAAQAQQHSGYVTIDASTTLKVLRFVLLVVVSAMFARPAVAHPAPFTYVDVRVSPGMVEVTLVAHVFDVGHDLHVDPSEQLLEPAFLSAHRAELVALFEGRLQLAGSGDRPVPASWSSVEPLPDRQSVQLRGRFEVSTTVLDVEALLFPYDPAHQTFINVYENDELTLQAILDASKTRLEYFSGSRQSALTLVQRFLPAGVRHVLLGADHLALLVGLMLLGGSSRQIALIIAAFLSAEAVTATVNLGGLAYPAARIIDPAIALGIVYVGTDNLMVRGGRDVRPWIAFGVGIIHGFWFADALLKMDLPRRALEWALFSFDAGVEIGQFVVVVGMAAVIQKVRAQGQLTGRRVAFCGSIAIIAVGTYLFVQRVFFPAGLL